MSDYTTAIPTVPGYYVYRFWAGDVCLYVGRVGDNGPRRVTRRIAEHRRAQPWWPDVSKADVATFATHDAVLNEEIRQIAACQPVHNKHRLDRAANDAADRERQREWRQRPGVREYLQQYMRDYGQQPEVQERRREWENRPEVKERRREYRQRPEVKERRREQQRKREQRPEVREQRRAYFQQPEVKAARRENSRRYRQRKREATERLTVSDGASPRVVAGNTSTSGETG